MKQKLEIPIPKKIRTLAEFIVTLLFIVKRSCSLCRTRQDVFNQSLEDCSSVLHVCQLQDQCYRNRHHNHINGYTVFQYDCTQLTCLRVNFLTLDEFLFSDEFRA